MNNSKIVIENVDLGLDTVVDKKPLLRERETELINILESINELIENKAWQNLKRSIFQNLVDGLEKKLKVESTKEVLNPPAIYRLNGELLWAKRYSDLTKLAEGYKLELVNVRKKLHETYAENN